MCQYYTKKTDRRPYEKFADGKTVCIEDEIPFELPPCWAWARLKDLSESIQYGYNAPAKVTGRIRMVRITDIQNNGILWGQVPYCDIEEADIPKYILHVGDLLFARTGGTVGKSHLVSDVPETAVYAGYLIRTRCTGSLSPQYAKRFMESACYWTQLQKDVIATAQPNCNGQKLGEMLIPLPPLAEQKRIVAKIEELFTDAEKIAMAQDGITHTAKRVNKKVLDLAIRGQLVPQDPNDEPAEELLNRIAEARQRNANKKSRRSKCEESVIFYGSDRSAYETRNGKTVCIDDEIPFDIPNSWAWTRIGSVGAMMRGSGIKRNETIAQGKPCIRYGEIYTSYNYKFTSCKSFVPRELFEQCSKIRPGDIVLTLTGETEFEIAKSLAYCGNEEIAAGGDLAIWTNHQCDPLYLAYMMYSPYMIQSKALSATIGPIVHTSIDRLSRLLIPLPPLAEQKRIVAKIEEVRKLAQSLTM